MRETAEVHGSIPPLSDIRSELLSLKVKNPPRDLPPQEKTLAETEWSGMSGAAVLSGDSLIGVVSEHAKRRGPVRHHGDALGRAHRPGPASRECG